MSLFLGVDGGGTKTQFVLVDAQGRVRGSWREGPAYYLETGLAPLQAMLVSGVQRVCQQAGLGAQQITFAFVGLPSYGEDSSRLPELEAVAAAALHGVPHACGNDMLCGWAGALAGADGINIVAGTGSIAYGEYESRAARAGGWGEVFSDEGSAYWIATQALRRFARMSDGREARSALYELVRSHFALRDDLDLCAAVYGPPPLTRSALAALAPLVTQAAAAGDPVACAVLESAAGELADMIDAVRDGLLAPAEHRIRVTCSGGLLAADSTLQTFLRTRLAAGARRYQWTPPRLPPGAGAALYAARRSGLALSAAAIDALEKASARG